ncbi:2'-5' RNA ligase [Paramagnetospirillum magnetotacticum MS-1]|uniref:RNA 2',3'-cyclic phosphodiesterase n=1 Tax=Paramagnetospirillum magnetotacticum MS-1 TaxID=272627 RepID=A0A0C2YSA3_PARME|nr:RNA 2',3'-cyclic phosphodiesterase [Paramagnetospirillum magnetotacticum]KIL98013.1 2'-5' RNA ligase [Paramagnetospirillum magnetotacticum MS-1]
MIRLFVGIGFDEELSARMAALQRGLPGARWVDPADLHLTLRFIGEVAEDLAEEIHLGLAALAEPPFALTLSGLGLFGDRHRAHTLWVGVERSDALSRLASRIESAVVRAGASPEPRKFNPHVTLARLKDTPSGRLQDFIDASGPFREELVAVERFTLFRSTLGRQGAHYDALEHYPLG